MVHILRLIDPAEWPEEKWDVGSVVLKRRALFYTETVFSPEIWKYNKWLLTQQEEKVPIDVLIEIWAHSMFCYWVTYNDKECDPERRHQMILNLKEYLKLPERVQEMLWPMWSFWHGTFVGEELVAEGWWDGVTWSSPPRKKARSHPKGIVEEIDDGDAA
jgi:hypothetical protein